MLKHLLAIILLSILIILFLSQFAAFLHIMSHLYIWFFDKLLSLFSNNSTGRLVSHVLALLCIPLIIALFPAFIYWLIRRGEMPYLMSIVWVLWVMLATIVALR